jgi:thiol-disulfide isomerase/thioredoxin
MKFRILGLAASLLCLASWQVTAQTLTVGDNAPAIEVSKWVKGDKIEKFDKDQTYVVEFWATWCGPCKTSIPHLTELQKKFKPKGVKIIGVSVSEENQSLVEPFVKTMGDKMDYSVGLDTLAKAGDSDSGKMAQNWLAASKAEGIPTAYIVKESKIVWIGHPMAMDKPLEKVTEPNFDLAKFVSEAREEMVKQKALAEAEEKKLEPLMKRLLKLGAAPSPKQVIEAMDEAFKESPTLEESLGLQKYMLMIQAKDKNAAANAMKLVEGVLKDKAQDLNELAWMNLDEENGPPEALRDVKMALKAAVRANELTKGEDGMILDTLALAYFKNGEIDKALENQEKAVKLVPTGDGADDLKTRLEKYKKAVADKKKP